jgi:putative flippase GtrA
VDALGQRTRVIESGRTWIREHQFSRFLISGGVNTGLTYLIYVGIVWFLPYTIAYTVTTILGIFLSYVLNALFVFRRKLSLSAALQYPIVYLAQYVVGLILLYLLVEKAGMSKFVAPLLIVVATVPVTFLLSRYVISGRKAADGTPEA